MKRTLILLTMGILSFPVFATESYKQCFYPDNTIAINKFKKIDGQEKFYTAKAIMFGEIHFDVECGPVEGGRYFYLNSVDLVCRGSNSNGSLFIAVHSNFRGQRLGLTIFTDRADSISLAISCL